MGFIVDYMQAIRQAVYTVKMHRTMQRRIAALRVEEPTRVDTHSPRTLAIVVPCYGHGQFLRQMVQSIAAQTRLPDEVVFVNDNSPDATREILESCIAEFKLATLTRPLVLHNEKNLGQAASLNKAIEAANADVIMILNDDDYLFHDAVAVTMKLLQTRPHIHMFGGQCVVFNDDRVLALHNKELFKVWNVNELPMKEYYPADTPTYETANDLNITHSGCSFYKSSWRAVGGYYEEKKKRVLPFSDRDFQLRFNLQFPIAILDVPISFWRGNSTVDAGVNS